MGSYPIRGPTRATRRSRVGQASQAGRVGKVNIMIRVIAVAILVATFQSPIGVANQETASSGATFVAYYWRAKPGQADAYNEYIRTVAVPIDEDARRAGAFEEVRTVTPAAGVTTDWTHLRIFRLKNAEAARGLGILQAKNQIGRAHV